MDAVSFHRLKRLNASPPKTPAAIISAIPVSVTKVENLSKKQPPKRSESDIGKSKVATVAGDQGNEQGPCAAFPNEVQPQMACVKAQDHPGQ